MASLNNSKTRKKIGRPPGAIPCGDHKLVIKMESKFRDQIHEAARAAGLSTRQFILQAVTQKMTKVKTSK